MVEGPPVVRVRHPLKRRRLTVTRIERLPPRMVRIVLGGEELQGFTSLGFDDHVKVFFPAPGAGRDADPAPAMRDFTPRHFDAERNELWIDFHLHDAGPAARWAATARVGQTLEIGGPKGSAVVAPDGIDVHALIGDETALPAISRRLEELPATARALVLIQIDADADRPQLRGPNATEVIWVPRDGRDGPPAHEVLEALHQARLPSHRCYAWIASDSQSARAIRAYLLEQRGFDRHWIKAAGYWQRGKAGAHDKIADDEPAATARAAASGDVR